MKDRIKEILHTFGADVCGIGAIERFSSAPEGFSPLGIYPECKSVVSFGVALPKGLYEVNPRLIYSHFNGAVATARVDEIAFLAAKRIEAELAVTAVPIPCDAPNEYWDAPRLTAKGLISMKHTAVACGLGDIGKNSLFVNTDFGNRLTLGAILLDVPLESDPMCEKICIPSCHRCIDACPVGAICDGTVDQSRCRPNTYGKTARGFATVDCNACRTACPMRNGKK